MELYDVISYFFFFFNDTATTEIYTLSLHDALPISVRHRTAPATGRDYAVRTNDMVASARPLRGVDDGTRGGSGNRRGDGGCPAAPDGRSPARRRTGGPAHRAAHGAQLRLQGHAGGRAVHRADQQPVRVLPVHRRVLPGSGLADGVQR